MKQKKSPRLLLAPPRPTVWSGNKLATIATSAVVAFSVIGVFSYLIVQTREVAFEAAGVLSGVSEIDSRATPFPLGVNPEKKLITENIAVDTYLDTHAPSQTLARLRERNWLGKAIQKLAMMDWYQNLATPTGRILVIASGERKEEIADHFGKILHWTEEEKIQFMDAIATSTPKIADGSFFPSTYVVAKVAKPDDVVSLITQRFKNEVLSRYGSDIEAIVPLKDALTIASLLEREASDFEDMRFISGVIWNRLFIGMNLQIDATLQYAKANESGHEWWPVPRPIDKDIDSPFNTYQNKGLPPNPIANSSLDAIVAALNPKKTDCLFYFHDKRGDFHCTPTYEDHVALLKQYYGRGR